MFAGIVGAFARRKNTEGEGGDGRKVRFGFAGAGDCARFQKYEGD